MGALDKIAGRSTNETGGLGTVATRPAGDEQEQQALVQPNPTSEARKAVGSNETGVLNGLGRPSARLTAAHDATKLTFAGADQTEGTHVTLALVGDLLLHGWVQRDAEKLVDRNIDDADERGASGYTEMFAAVKEDLREADLTLGNLEIPLARDIDRRGNKVDVGEYDFWDNRAYTTFPAFNAHPAFALALAEIGFDAVTTANNHALDRGSLGINLTIDALDAAGIEHIGTAKRRDPAGGSIPPSERYQILEAKNVRIGLLGYTEITNAPHSPQVSYISDQMLEDVRMLRDSGEVDLVVFAVHWGDEYQNQASTRQKRWARQLAEAGVDVIMGSHPHVLQPMEKIVTAGPDGEQHETLVLYSLGNFIANQGQPDYKDHGKYTARRSSAIVYVEATKPKDGGKAVLSNVGYVPVKIDLRKPVAIDRTRGNDRERNHITKVLGYSGNVLPPDMPLRQAFGRDR
jgi:poly-gamma-glutamate synthesis protein (capsule biosynthesis protein)